MKTFNNLTREELLDISGLCEFEILLKPEILSGYADYVSQPNPSPLRKAFLGGAIMVTFTSPHNPNYFIKNPLQDIKPILAEVHKVKNNVELDPILNASLAQEEYSTIVDDYIQKLEPIIKYRVKAKVTSVKRGFPLPIDFDYLT
jgi:hypothetical protein